MQTVLVIGAGGFVGRHLVKYLKQKEISFFSGFQNRSCQKNVHINLMETDTLGNIPKSVTAVINCAAMVPENQSNHCLYELDGVNGYGMLGLLEHAKQHHYKLVHVSSAHNEFQVNSDGQLPFDPGAYETSKFAGDSLCTLYRRNNWADVSVVKPSYIYGTNMRETTVFMKFLRNALDGRALHVTGHPLQSFNFVYVKDVVRTIAYALTKQTPILYATAREETTLKNLAKIMCAHGNPESHCLFRKPTPSEPVQPQYRLPEPSIPLKYSLEEGLADMMETILPCK